MVFFYIVLNYYRKRDRKRPRISSKRLLKKNENVKGRSMRRLCNYLRKLKEKMKKPSKKERKRRRNLKKTIRNEGRSLKLS